MQKADLTTTGPQAKLSLWDATSIIVGIIIGSSIYESTPTIAGCMPSVAWLVAAWLLGAGLMVVGALCYAELANAFPRHGGDYVYLTEAFGRQVGFVFAWMQFWIVRPGSIGAVAFVFARYAQQLWPLDDRWRPLMVYAVLSIVVLSCVNLLGLEFGKNAQNSLTALKYLGLAMVVAVGLCYTRPSASIPLAPAAAASKPGSLDLPFAMILILFAYSGWNEMAYVATEVREPQKNVLKALLLGSFLVTAIYLLAALSFVHALGLSGVQHSTAVATDVVQLALGSWGGRAISMLICITALGAINGMLFTGSRIFYAMGKDHRLYSWLGRWDDQRHAPVRTLAIQAVVTLALIIGFGLTNSSFDKMVCFTSLAFWAFLLLVAVSVMVLRLRHSRGAWWLFPLPVSALLTTVFCLSCGYMVYSSADYAIEQFQGNPLLFWGSNGAVLLLGIVLSFVK